MRQHLADRDSSQEEKSSAQIANVKETDHCEYGMIVVSHIVFSISQKFNRKVWIADLGVLSHMIYDDTFLYNIMDTNATVTVGNERDVPVLCEGHLDINVINNDGSVHTVTLLNISYVPFLMYNLLSVGDKTPINQKVR